MDNVSQEIVYCRSMVGSNASLDLPAIVDSQSPPALQQLLGVAL